MKIIAISFGCSTTALLAHSSFILGSTNAELAHEPEIAKQQKTRTINKFWKEREQRLPRRAIQQWTCATVRRPSLCFLILT